MVAARTAARGLTPAELDGIRDTLAAGRRPKVMFTETAGQIAGQIGQVVRLEDPAAGEEYVVVRFGRDELPFSPTDLMIAPRGAPARKAVEKAAETVEPAQPEPAPGPELRLSVPPVPVARQEEPVAAAPPPPRKAGRVAKPKPPPGLTVTLSYTEGEWTVAATQGTKALAKPYVIKAVEALKMVALLDVPGVQEAVEQIVSAERTAVQEHAQRLRDQLAEVEAKLAELG